MEKREGKGGEIKKEAVIKKRGGTTPKEEGRE